MKTLISGTSSGLGKFVLESLEGAVSYKRGSKTIERYDTIIHCAWDSEFKCGGADYINNALELTRKLLRIKHDRFIFISSIDVYPKNKRGLESQDIDEREICGIYGLTKLICEKEVLKDKYANVFRLPCLMGRNDNSIKKALVGKKVSVSSDSTFNVINYSTVVSSLKKYIPHGVYNVPAKDNVTIGSLNKDKEIFGSFMYKTPEISCCKAEHLFPELVKPSMQNIEDWNE